MKRLKKGLSLLLVAVIVVSCFSFGLGKLTTHAVPAQTGTIRTHIHTKKNSFLNAYGTDDEISLKIFYTDGTTFVGNIDDPNDDNDNEMNDTNYCSFNITIKPVSYIQIIDVTGSDDWTPDTMAVEINETGSTWTTVGSAGEHKFTNANEAVTMSPNPTTWFSAHSYTITFNAAGGTGGTADSWIYSGTLTAPTVSRAGYTFNGWSPAVPAMAPNAAATYTAQWTPNNYNITFDAKGGTGGTSVSMACGSALSAPTVSRTGYTFTGWSPGVPGTVPAGDATYTATWTQNNYTYTFNANGGTGGTSGTLHYGDALSTLIPGVTRTGYSLNSATPWSPAVPINMPDSPFATYAQWTANSYTVTFDAGTGGTVTPATKGVTFDGTYGTLPAAPDVSKTGYSFGGWWTTGAGGTGTQVTSGTVVSTASNHSIYAQWTANSYTVTFDAGMGGTVTPASKSVTYDGTYGTLPAAPDVAKTSYTFGGWWTSAGGTGTQVTSGTVVSTASNHSIYAKWTANSYTVTFDAGTGGTVTPASKSVTYDGTYGTLPVAPDVAKTGYTFGGWWTGASGTGTQVTSGTVVSTVSNHSIYAKWTANSYTVTFDAGTGGTVTPATKGVTFDGTYGTLPAAPDVSKTGYTFGGWWTGAGGTGIQVTSGTVVSTASNHSIYAKWTANSYTVTFDAGTGGTVTPATKSVTFDGTYGTLPAAPDVSKTGYTFGGWWTGAGGTGTQVTSGTVVSMASSHTLYAKWTANPYTVTFSAGTGGTVTPTSKNVTFDSTYSTLPAAPDVAKTGYTFAGWWTGSGGTGAQITSDTVVKTASAHTLYAKWTANGYTIRYNLNTTVGGSGSTANSTHTYDTLTNLSDNGFAKVGYNFTGWSTTQTGSKEYNSGQTVNIVTTNNQIIDFYAVWAAANYTLTFNAGAGGTVTPGTKSVAYGSAYGTLPAAPDVSKTGYTFGGWWTGDGGTGTQVTANTVVSTAYSHSVYAKWTAAQYTLTFVAGTGGTVTPVTKSVTYDSEYGALPAAPDVSKAGYSFGGWWTGDGGTGTQVTASTVVSTASGHSVYAKWTANTYTVTFNAQEGSVSTGTKDVTYDSSYGTLPTPEREGYSFNGWYTQASGGTKIDSSASVSITSAQTIYAQWAVIPVNYTALDSVVQTFSDVLVTATPVLSGDGTTKDSVYGYGDTEERQAAADAYDTATELQAQAPLPNTAENRSKLAGASTQLNGAIDTLLSHPNPAVYTYVNAEITAAKSINLNRYSLSSIDELQTAVNNVVTGKGAAEQAQVNAYTTELYKQRAGSSALVPYQDSKAPKINVMETNQTMKDSGISIPGFNPDNYGDVSYVYPGKGYQTYYCYTNSENPVVMVNIQDIADGNGRLSYPAKLNITGKSGTVNAGFMSLNYDSDAHRAKYTAGTRTVSNPYSSYTVGMNYSESGSDYYSQAGYILLKPEFIQSYNSKQFAVYTISGVDDASAAGNTADTSSLAGGTQDYRNGKPITTTNTAWTPKNTITIFVEYRNTMSKENGTYYEDGRAANSFKAYNTLGADGTWVTRDYFYRNAAGATNDEILKRSDTIYNSSDPTLGQKNLGCFYYALDSVRDAAIISAYGNGSGAIAATNLMKQAIKTDAGGVYSSNTVAWLNTSASLQHTIKSASRLVYVHLADRWGNVYNNILKVNNVDPVIPAISNVTDGTATLNESGGSGTALVRVYQYAYEGSPSFVVPCWSDKLITSLNVINEPDNTLDIQLDSSKTNRFTLYVKDKAGNEVTKTVYTDSSGKLSITVNDPDNMQAPVQRSMSARAMATSSTTDKVYTFLLNDSITVNLNTPEPVKETYEITFDAADKGLIGTETTQVLTLNEGDAITVPTVKAKPGWCFAGWDKSVPASATESVTFTAQYIRTAIHVTKLQTGLKVNIQGWVANYKYQIWSYQKITSDLFLDTAADVSANQWVLSKAYTLGSSSEAILEPDGSISFLIDNFQSPDSNYTVSVRIADENNNFIDELRDSFTPVEVQEVKITKVLVDGNYCTGKEIKEIKAGNTALIKVIGNNVPNTVYTATVMKTSTVIPVSKTNEFLWNISALTPDIYTVKISATNGNTTDTKNITFNLYSTDSSIHYGDISSMGIAAGSETMIPRAVTITPLFTSGVFKYQIGEPGRTPVYISEKYEESGAITYTAMRYGIYQVYGYVNRTDASTADSSYDDAIIKTFAVKRSKTIPSSAALTANVNVNNPISKNTPIHFTATSSIGGIGSTPVVYSFWRYDASGYTLIKDWSGDNTLNWTPARVGIYTIEVRAKGIDAGSYEVSKSITVNVTDAVEHIAQGVTISINEAELSANAKARMPILIKAAATSADGEDLLYKFNIYDVALGSVTLQNYSANQTCTWTPRKSGTYTISVLVNNKASFGKYDAVQSINVTVK